jgi:hypothetical protein
VPKTPKLHIAKTNWQEYRNLLDARIQLNISFETPDEIEELKETWSEKYTKKIIFFF